MTGIDLRNETSTRIPGVFSWTHFKLDRRSPAYWRVTFDHPHINTLTATTIRELSALVDLIERDAQADGRIHVQWSYRSPFRTTLSFWQVAS